MNAQDTFAGLIAEAIDEANRAMIEFPQPDYVITKLVEECGETIKAAVHCADGRGPLHEVRSEMKQATALLYRLWVEGDRTHNLPPVHFVAFERPE